MKLLEISQRQSSATQYAKNKSANIVAGFEMEVIFTNYIKTDNDLDRKQRRAQQFKDNAQQVAALVESIVSTPVHISHEYHGDRPAGKYVIEPDESITVDDSYNNNSDLPVEIISPPIPLSTCLEHLRLLHDGLQEIAYTNGSTGLHIGMSVKDRAIDYTKLLLFFNDSNVLEKFGRLSSRYCAKALDSLRTRVREINQSGNIGVVGNAIDAMRNGLSHLAGQALSNSVNFIDVSLSMTMKRGGYVEFRQMGGNYLETPFTDIQAIIERFAYAIGIASDPIMAKNEYMKKLYKLLVRQQPDLLPHNALRGLIIGLTQNPTLAKTQLSRQLTAAKKHAGTSAPLPDASGTIVGGKSFSVTSPNGLTTVVTAKTADGAKLMAKKQFPKRFDYPVSMLSATETMSELELDDLLAELDSMYGS